MQILTRVVSYAFSFEAFFVVFLMAGEFKLLPVFAPISRVIDLTALSMVVSVVVGMGVVLRRVLGSKPGQLRITPVKILYLVLVGVFIAYALANYSLYPPDPMSTRKALTTATVLLWCAIAAGVIMNTRDRMTRFVFLVMISGAVLAVALIVRIISGDLGAIGQTGGFGEGYHRIGRLGGAGVIISLIMLRSMSSIRQRAPFLVLMVLCTLGMIFSGHRAGAFMLALTLLIILVFYARRYAGAKSRPLLSRGHLMAIMVALVGLFSVAYATSERARIVVHRFQAYERRADGRVEIYNTTLQMFFEHPIVGVGYGRFQAVSGMVYRQPHNLVLEMLVEMGMIVMPLFLVVYFLWVPLTRRRAVVGDPLHMVLVSLFWFFFLNAMVSGDINDNRILFVIAIMLTYLTFDVRRTDREFELLRSLRSPTGTV